MVARFLLHDSVRTKTLKSSHFRGDSKIICPQQKQVDQENISLSGSESHGLYQIRTTVTIIARKGIIVRQSTGNGEPIVMTVKSPDYLNAELCGQTRKLIASCIYQQFKSQTKMSVTLSVLINQFQQGFFRSEFDYFGSASFLHRCLPASFEERWRMKNFVLQGPAYFTVSIPCYPKPNKRRAEDYNIYYNLILVSNTMYRVRRYLLILDEVVIFCMRQNGNKECLV